MWLIPLHMLLTVSPLEAFGLEHYRPICSAWLLHHCKDLRVELTGLTSQHFIVICIYYHLIYFNKPLVPDMALNTAQNR